MAGEHKENNQKGFAIMSSVTMAVVLSIVFTAFL